MVEYWMSGRWPDMCRGTPGGFECDQAFSVATVLLVDVVAELDELSVHSMHDAVC